VQSRPLSNPSPNNILVVATINHGNHRTVEQHASLNSLSEKDVARLRNELNRCVRTAGQIQLALIQRDHLIPVAERHVISSDFSKLRFFACQSMIAIVVHGMGRTPLSMLLLAIRLRRHGFQTILFGYSATFESFERCASRLAGVLGTRAKADYIVIGHSLGSVLLRAACSRVVIAPRASFFLAPPTTACRAARFFARRLWYRILMGQMGQRLADTLFMEALPAPAGVTRIYAGTAGPVGRLSPFGSEANDGILTVQESALPGVPMILVPKLHTFIMNSRAIAQDIVEVCAQIRQPAC
jgi:hypothetical protein